MPIFNAGTIVRVPFPHRDRERIQRQATLLERLDAIPLEGILIHVRQALA